MNQDYREEELLPLSGIQHFLFCRRQWALIHVEQQWKDNHLTVEGKQLHKRVDDPFFTESRNDQITSRSLPVSSYRLGLSGVCDLVEFTRDENGIAIPGRQGRYSVAPVEYKHGRPKREPMDEAQLCAQAICLEEMLSVAIPQGFIFYGETRRREEVMFTQELRQIVEDVSKEMHSYFRRGHTPRVKTSKACVSCSINEICLPVLQEKVMPASRYIQKQIEGN